jgi:hypothetical protein
MVLRKKAKKFFFRKKVLRFEKMLYLCAVLEIILTPLSWKRLRLIPQMQRDFFIYMTMEERKQKVIVYVDGFN